MKKPLRNILVVGAIGLASLLPMKGLEAQTVIQEDTTKTEKIQKNKFNIGLKGDLINKYRFWGMPFLDSPVYKQSLNVNYGNFSASTTGQVNVKDHKLYAIPTYVGFSKSLSKKISSHLGYTLFKFNLGESWESASVVSAGLTTNFPLNPSITYNRLFGFGGGEYIEGSLSKNIPLTKSSSINLSGKLGFNNKVFLWDRAGFTHLEGCINIPIKLLDKINLSPYINYFQSLSDIVKTGFNGGLSASARF